MSFLDTSILRWFLKPYFVAGQLTIKVATRTGATALKLVDRFLGLQFLRDLSEFFLAFEGMYDGFKERAARVHALLRDQASGFVVVAGPTRLALEEALYFHQRLREKRLPFLGFIVNRVHPDPGQEIGPRPAAAGGATRVDPKLAGALLQIYRDQQQVARGEHRAIARLEVDTGERPILVPELDQDVHDLRGLRDVGDAMLGEISANGRARRRVSS
jgi:anion-transporting  ArsA/GET3 family ATPase